MNRYENSQPPEANFFPHKLIFIQLTHPPSRPRLCVGILSHRKVCTIAYNAKSYQSIQSNATEGRVCGVAAYVAFFPVTRPSFTLNLLSEMSTSCHERKSQQHAIFIVFVKFIADCVPQVPNRDSRWQFRSTQEYTSIAMHAVERLTTWRSDFLLHNSINIARPSSLSQHKHPNSRRDACSSHQSRRCNH